MKNYVKEYKGYKVPRGATHYGDSNPIAYFYKFNAVNTPFFYLNQEWKRSSVCDAYIKDGLVELPEAPQEWMPEVGEECEVLDTCYAHPKHSEVKVKGFYNKQVWLTLPGGEDRVVLIANCKFRPLKTQQEKDREAFVERVKQLLPKSDTDDLILSGKLFDLGFTAPKAGE